MVTPNSPVISASPASSPGRCSRTGPHRSGSSGYDEHGLQRALPAPVRESVALMACYTAMAPLAGAILFTRARRAIPCRRLVVASHRRREHGGGWGPEELPENQGAADEQRGDVDR